MLFQPTRSCSWSAVIVGASLLLTCASAFAQSSARADKVMIDAARSTFEIYDRALEADDEEVMVKYYDDDVVYIDSSQIDRGKETLKELYQQSNDALAKSKSEGTRHDHFSTIVDARLIGRDTVMLVQRYADILTDPGASPKKLNGQVVYILSARTRQWKIISITVAGTYSGSTSDGKPLSDLERKIIDEIYKKGIENSYDNIRRLLKAA